jgi:hypothetical protein
MIRERPPITSGGRVGRRKIRHPDSTLLLEEDGKSDEKREEKLSHVARRTLITTYCVGSGEVLAQADESPSIIMLDNCR